MLIAEKDEVLRKFSDYPFSSDEVFQVRAISLFLDAELDAQSGSLERYYSKV